MVPTIITMRSFDAPSLSLEPTEGTWRELRDTLAAVKEYKVPLTIEVIAEDEIILGAYLEHNRTYLRFSIESKEGWLTFHSEEEDPEDFPLNYR